MTSQAASELSLGVGRSPCCAQDHPSLSSLVCGATNPALIRSRILRLVPHRKSTEASFGGWLGLAAILGAERTGQQQDFVEWGTWRAEGLWEADVEHGWLGGSHRARQKAVSPEPLSCKASCLSFLRHPRPHNVCWKHYSGLLRALPPSVHELLWPSPVPALHSTLHSPCCHGGLLTPACAGLLFGGGGAVFPLCTGDASVCTPLLFWHEETPSPLSPSRPYVAPV